MNTAKVNMQQPDGIFAEFGAGVNRFPRSVKEAFGSYAEVDVPEEEFVAHLNAMEASYKPLFWTVMFLAVLMIMANVLGWVQ